MHVNFIMQEAFGQDWLDVNSEDRAVQMAAMRRLGMLDPDPTHCPTRTLPLRYVCHKFL